MKEKHNFDGVYDEFEKSNIKEKEKDSRLKELNKRISKPLFQPGKRTSTHGKNKMKVSAQAGIKGFFR